MAPYTEKSEKKVGVKKAERTETQKRHKREKKKRRAVRKAQKKPAEEKEPAARTKNTEWRRVGTSDGCRKAVNRPVDDDKINILLKERSQAKADKDYTKSDGIAETMVELGIFYFDARKEWHTR